MRSRLTWSALGDGFGGRAGSPTLGIILTAALILNMAVAGLVGVAVPMGLKSMRVDPALASRIFVTTFTDVLGFLFFLGLATLVLSQLPVA